MREIMKAVKAYIETHPELSPPKDDVLERCVSIFLRQFTKRVVVETPVAQMTRVNLSAPMRRLFKRYKRTMGLHNGIVWADDGTHVVMWPVDVDPNPPKERPLPDDIEETKGHYVPVKACFNIVSPDKLKGIYFDLVDDALRISKDPAFPGSALAAFVFLFMKYSGTMCKSNKLLWFRFGDISIAVRSVP